MTEPSLLPPRRQLPAATADRIRGRVLTGTSRPAPPSRRWLPLAAAAAVVALVAGAVTVAANRPTDAGPAVSPAATPTPVAIPSLAEVAERCPGVPDFRYLTRYTGDGAVTWLLVDEERRESLVCTWKVGSTGRMASFVNEWTAPLGPWGYSVTDDNMMPGSADGPVHPQDAHLERNRHVLVGKVRADVARVILTGPDGEQHEPALASGWFVFHYRGELRHITRGGVAYPTTGERYTVTGYDAAGTVVTG
jgi:hypothetical protein